MNNKFWNWKQINAVLVNIPCQPRSSCNQTHWSCLAHRELPFSFVFVDCCWSTTRLSTQSQQKEKYNLYSLKKRTVDICVVETYMESSWIVNSHYLLAFSGESKNFSSFRCFIFKAISIIFLPIVADLQKCFPPFRISFTLSSVFTNVWGVGSYVNHFKNDLFSGKPLQRETSFISCEFG